MNSKFKRLIVGLLVTMVLVTGISTIPTSADMATTTTYDYKWWSVNTIRNKLDTSYKSKSTSYSTYTTADTFSNETKKPVKHTFEDSRTSSSSVNLGAKVTVKAVEVEAGGEVRYSRTKTYSTSISVPKKSKMTLKVRTKTEKLKYSSKVQRQDLWIHRDSKKHLYTKWQNTGSSSTAVSTQKVLSPQWLLK